jgi:hypothetical protein
MWLLNSFDHWRKESQMSNFVMPLSEALGMSSVQVWKENNGLTSRDQINMKRMNTRPDLMY